MRVCVSFGGSMFLQTTWKQLARFMNRNNITPK